MFGKRETQVGENDNDDDSDDDDNDDDDDNNDDDDDNDDDNDNNDDVDDDVDDDDDNNDDDDDDDDDDDNGNDVERSSLHFPRQEEKKVIESRKLIEYDPGKYNRPNVSLGMRKNGSKLNGKVFQLVTSFSINLVTSEGGDSSEMLRTIIF